MQYSEIRARDAAPVRIFPDTVSLHAVDLLYTVMNDNHPDATNT